MSRETWFPRILVALLVALLGAAVLGGACVAALGASDAGRSPASVGRAVGKVSAADVAPSGLSPWVDPDLLRRLERADGEALLRVIVVLRMSSEDPAARLTRDLAVDRVLFVPAMC